MNPAELHDLLAARFVREVIGPAIRNGARSTDLVVLFESCQAGTMQALARHYELKPATVVGLMEAALQRAIERFAEEAMRQ